MDDKRYGDPQSAAPAALRWRYDVFGNSIPARRDLIRVAVTRDISQAVPISGAFVGAPGEYLGMAIDVLVVSE